MVEKQYEYLFPWGTTIERGGPKFLWGEGTSREGIKFLGGELFLRARGKKDLWWGTTAKNVDIWKKLYHFAKPIISKHFFMLQMSAEDNINTLHKSLLT